MSLPEETSHNQSLDPETSFDLHGNYLYRYAMFRLRDSSVAEEVVRETFLFAVRSSERFEGRSLERTWLVGILKHKIIDHFRKIALRHEVPAAGRQAGEEFYPFRRTGEWVGHWREDQAPSNWNLDASTILERKEFWETLDRSLAELPQRTAMAFTLREIDCLSSEEVCDILNLSRNHLWVMLHRARMHLRNSFEAEWFRNEPRDSQRQPHVPAKRGRSIEFPGLQRALKLVGIAA